jgi:hypothetical protein
MQDYNILKKNNLSLTSGNITNKSGNKIFIENI